MASFNKVILLGNLTRDPESRVTPGGLSICKFGLATTRVFKGQDGTQKEETTFVDVDVFGRQAEVIAKYFTKGRPILLEGRLRLDSWESKTGDKRSKLTVILENFQFIGGRAEEAPQSTPHKSDFKEHAPPARPSSQSSPQSTSETSENEEELDDDVPF